MTSFFARSFEFFSDKPASICAFLATTRPIFNSSIIPVALSMNPLWETLSDEWKCEKILQVFLLSDTLQFSQSLLLNDRVDTAFTLHLLNKLIHESRYFCRTLKHFTSFRNASLALVCEKVKSLEILTINYVDKVNVDIDYNYYDELDPYLYDSENNCKLQLTSMVRLSSQLKELNLFWTSINDEELRHLSGFSSLEKLSLEFANKITGNGFVHLSGMRSSLRALNISYMRSLCDEGLLCLPELPSLADLCLSSSIHVTDVGFTGAVTKQKNLRILDLSNCSRISPEGIEGCLRDLVQLTDLDLSRCRHFDEGWLSALAAIDGSLRRLSLAWCCSISEEGVRILVNEMKELTFLDLSYCTVITDMALKAISDLKILTELKIVQLPQISDEGIRYLKKCPILSSIEFGDNLRYSSLVPDLCLKAFSEMKALSSLQLVCGTCYTNSGVAKLADSNSLETLLLVDDSKVTTAAMLSLSKSKSLRRIQIARSRNLQDETATRVFEGSIISFEIIEKCLEFE